MAAEPRSDTGFRDVFAAVELELLAWAPMEGPQVEAFRALLPDDPADLRVRPSPVLSAYLELARERVAGPVTRPELRHAVLAAFAALDRPPEPLESMAAMTCLAGELRVGEVRETARPALECDLAPGLRSRFLVVVGMADVWCGDLLGGLLGLSAARELAEEAGLPSTRALAAMILGKCEGMRGHLGAAVAHIEEAHRVAVSSDLAWYVDGAAECAVLVHLATGDTGAFLATLGYLVDHGLGGPSGFRAEYVLELATAHAVAGRTDEAERVLALLGPVAPHETAGAVSREWAEWVRHPREVAAMSALEARMADLTGPMDWGLEARLAWLLGAQHHAAGRSEDAQRLLVRSRLLYGRRGALGLAQYPERLLRPPLGEEPAPGPPAALLTLTPGERRVALAVRAGHTNAEVADLLFLSVRTVETHLGAIYRKLGVPNRTALVALA